MMARTFDQWLAKPSALRMLRSLLSDSTRSCNHRCRQRRFASDRASASRVYGSEIFGDIFEEEPERKSRYSNPLASAQKQDNGNTYATEVFSRMSLNSKGTVATGQDKQSHVSYQVLLHQAKVDDPKLLNHLLVDEPRYRDKMNFWIGILEFRQRLHGVEGVRAVWRGMRSRGVDLPTTGNEADTLWSTFISSFVGKTPLTASDNAFGNELVEYADSLNQRTGCYYLGLHKSIVGVLMRSSPRLAAWWDHGLFKAGLMPPKALVFLADEVMQDPRPETMHRVFPHFRKMYLRSHVRNLYDIYVGKALSMNLDKDRIQRWHDLFVTNDDLPSPAMRARDSVQELFRASRESSSGEDIDELGAEQSPAHIEFSRARMSEIVGEVHGIRPKELSDSFVTRMFATRAFSPDLVIQGLHVLGARRIGPQALREMAARLQSLEEFREKLAILETKGIDLSKHVFCRLLLKLANASDESGEQLFRVLMARDQHPEAYEDSATQEALLLSFLDQRLLDETQLTMMTLSLMNHELSTLAWNRYLQFLIKHGRLEEMLYYLNAVRSQKVVLERITVSAIEKHILSPRRHAHRPQTRTREEMPLKALSLVTQMWIHAEEHGTPITVSQWNELLKQRGMLGHWTEVEKLTLWLASRFKAAREREREDFRDRSTIWTVYGKRARDLGDDVVARHPGAWRQSSKYLALFDRVAIGSRFVWGFRTAARRNWLRPGILTDPELIEQGTIDPDMPCEPWAGGLVLLQRLNDFGLQPSTYAVRRAFKQSMWMLFGPGYSKQKENEIARKNNQLSLAHYVRHANEIWEGRLFPGMDEYMLDETDMYHQARLLLFLFGSRRPVAVRSWYWWDVSTWIKHLSATGELVDKRDLSERKKDFERGRFQHKGLVRRQYLPPLFTHADDSK